MLTLHAHHPAGALPLPDGYVFSGEVNALRHVINAALNRYSAVHYHNALEEIAALYHYHDSDYACAITTQMILKGVIDILSYFPVYNLLVGLPKRVHVHVHDTRWRTVDVIVQPFALLTHEKGNHGNQEFSP